MRKGFNSIQEILDSLSSSLNSISFSELSSCIADSNDEKISNLAKNLMGQLHYLIQERIHEFEDVSRNSDIFIEMLFEYLKNTVNYVICRKTIEACSEMISNLNKCLDVARNTKNEIKQSSSKLDDAIENYLNTADLEIYKQVAQENGVSLPELLTKCDDNRIISSIVETIKTQNVPSRDCIDKFLHIKNSLKIMKLKCYHRIRELNIIKARYIEIVEEHKQLKSEYYTARENSYSQIVAFLKNSSVFTRRFLSYILGVETSDENCGYYMISKKISSYTKRFIELWDIK